MTFTVKLDWAALVGVPLIVPFLFKATPTGNDPDASVHKYGAVPLEAVSVDEYAVPIVPLSSEEVVIVREGELEPFEPRELEEESPQPVAAARASAIQPRNKTVFERARTRIER